MTHRALTTRSLEVLRIEAGDVFADCNFSQLTPDTPILSLENITLTFERCNLTNVRVSESWTLVDCNTTQIDYCAHLEPSLGLPLEPDDCRHVVETETIHIDDGVAITVCYREHRVIQ